MHFSQCTWEAKGQNHHSCVLTSRPMSLASGFRHLGYVVRLGPLILVPRCCRHWHFNSFWLQIDQMLYSPAFWHLKYCMKMKKDTPWTSILLMVKRNTPCTSTQRRWIHPARPHFRRLKGMQPVHRHCMQHRKIISRPHYWCMVERRKTPLRSHCWLSTGIHPHIHNVDWVHSCIYVLNCRKVL